MPRAKQNYQDICREDMDEDKFRVKAREHFKKAFPNFKAMLHLKGMYLAKQHEAALYEDGDLENITAQYESEALARKIRREYFDHIKHNGYDKCSYIPRHHGDQISLLTEIVEKNKKQALFIIQKKNKDKQDSKYFKT